jgi:ATP-dependent Clp protease ATP-binding subunit ClpC
MRLCLTEAATEYLAGKGYDPTLGARPLRRVVQREVEDALSEGLLAGRFGKNDQVTIDIQDVDVAAPIKSDDLLALDEALGKLAAKEPKESAKKPAPPPEQTAPPAVSPAASYDWKRSVYVGNLFAKHLGLTRLSSSLPRNTVAINSENSQIEK